MKLIRHILFFLFILCSIIICSSVTQTIDVEDDLEYGSMGHPLFKRDSSGIKLPVSKLIRKYFSQFVHGVNKQKLKAEILHVIKAMAEPNMIGEWYKIPQQDRTCLENFIFSQFRNFLRRDEISCVFGGNGVDCVFNPNVLQPQFPCSKTAFDSVVQLGYKAIQSNQVFLRLPWPMQREFLQLYSNLLVQYKYYTPQRTFTIMANFVDRCQQFLQQYRHQLAQQFRIFEPILTGSLQNSLMIILQDLTNILRTLNSGRSHVPNRTIIAANQILPFVRSLKQKFSSAYELMPEHFFPSYLDYALNNDIDRLLNKFYSII